MNWEQIEKVNKEIKTTLITAKKKNEYGQWEVVSNEYVEVKERVIAYRKLYPQGVISTELTFTENYVLCEARATNENNLVIATGHARELLNKAFAVENAETSAIGRALGFMGLGISTSIATKEDMENTESPSGVFDQPVLNVKALADEFKTLYSKEETVRILNGLKKTEIDQIGAEDLQKYINFKKYGKKQTNQGEGNQP